jgi:hypothetical protein
MTIDLKILRVKTDFRILCQSASQAKPWYYSPIKVDPSTAATPISERDKFIAQDSQEK